VRLHGLDAAPVEADDPLARLGLRLAPDEFAADLDERGVHRDRGPAGVDVGVGNTEFSGSEVSFAGAKFSGGMVIFPGAEDWTLPPEFPWTDTLPPA
jgi:hypothetical protein